MNDIIVKWGAFEMSLYNSDDFIVDNIENLSWASSELATTSNPFIAGDKIQNKHPMPRDITITLKPTKDKGDYSPLVHKIGRLFNNEVTLIWKDKRIQSFTVNPVSATGENFPDIVDDLIISGTVNEFDCPRFEDGVRLVFNVHCENSYWTAKTTRTATAGLIDVNSYCPYSEVSTGIKIEIPDLLFANALDYYDIDFITPHSSYTIRFRRINHNLSLTAAYSSFLFERGKVAIMMGETKETAVDATSKIKWLVIKNNGTGYEQVNEFPSLPISSEAFDFIATRTSSDGTAQVRATASWNPQFI